MQFGGFAAKAGVLLALMVFGSACTPVVTIRAPYTPTPTLRPVIPTPITSATSALPTPSPIPPTVTTTATLTPTAIVALSDPTATSAPAAAAEDLACTVATRSLRLRAGPGTNFGVVAGMIEGQRVRAGARTANSSWIRVRTATGQQGWVAANLMRCDGAPSQLPLAEP